MMGLKKKYTCDVCRKVISEGHSLLYMVEVIVRYGDHGDDRHKDTYYVHNDFTNHCMGKLWDLLVKDRH